MRLVFDMQGSHSMALSNTGMIYELQTLCEEEEIDQSFGLEGSLPALLTYFTEGKALIERVIEAGGETSELDIVFIGPDAELYADLEAEAIARSRREAAKAMHDLRCRRSAQRNPEDV